MHFGVDVREACVEKRTGKGQWTYGFVSELLTRDCDLTLFSDRPLPKEWQEIIEKHADRFSSIISQKNGIAWHLETARTVLKSRFIDTYISTVSYIVPCLIGRKKSCIPIVHDLIAFQNEPHDKKAQFIERITLKRAVFFAASICTVSESTKNDLQKRYPSLSSKIIHPIFAGPFTHPRETSASDGKTILCIATLCPRKNQLRLIEAFTSLPEKIRSISQLILVGKRGWNDEEIVKKIESTKNVVWKNYLSDTECSRLLSQAAVFAFPSLYEGFGMPVLDAFAAGVPVLTSDRGSLKEVAGDAALLIDPEDSKSISEGLEKLLTDASLRETLIQKGLKQAKNFSWKKTVDLFLASL